MSMFGEKSDTMSLSDAIKSSANQMLFRTLLNNPEKRAKVLELLTQEGIVDENSSPNKYCSPIKRLQKNNSLLNSTPKSKNNTLRLESPSALARKRALQRLESSSSDEPSQKLPSPPFVGTPKSYDQILEGVVAYCEIRSNGEDRSAAIKTVMQSMGAIVKDNLCRGVTHVILKDGLYTTYRKAKLWKMHVVSVLWLEAVRKHKFKVPEAKFPAVCADAYDANITKICQDMQKDYDEVIQDELNKTKEFDNRRRSEVSINNFVTDRNKWRSTMYGSHFKDPHNRTEIASPYKYITTNPELSESDSYVSVGSDVVPSSQPVAKVLFPDPEPDEILPESNLVNAKNSFELEKASKIRSPESILKENCKKSMKKISVDKEDSLKLHVTTTDDSNLNSTGKTRNTSSSRNLLEDSSINKKSSSEELHLHVSEDSTDKEIQNNIIPTISKSNSVVSTLSSDSEISKTRSKRRTVGLKRPKKSVTESLVTPKRKSNLNESNLSSEDSNIENKPQNVKKNNRRQTLFKINSPIQENETSVRKTRRRTLVNLQITNDESMAEDIKRNVENNSKINITSPRKNRRKTTITTEDQNITNDENIVENDKKVDNNSEINISPKRNRRQTTTKPEDKLEEELKKIFGENEDVIGNTEELEKNTEPKNNVKKNRRKTVANTPKKPAEINEKSSENNNIRKSNRKTIAPSYNETKNSEETSSNSCKNFLENTPNNKITMRKSRRITTVPESTEIQPSEEQKTSDSSIEKSRPRVRRLFDPNQQVSLSQLIWDSEIPENSPTVNVSPPKKVKYKVPLVHIPMLYSEKAKKKTRSTVKTAKSVPPKITTQETKKRKSVKALTFSSTSSDTDLEKPVKKINTPVRKSERIAKTPKNFKLPSSTDLDTLSSDSSKTPKKSQTSLKSKLSQIDDKRRSTLDFVPQRSKKSLDESRLTQKQKMRTKLSSIVCTRFHKPDVQVFQQIVKKLGGFVVEDEVSKKTTHLVAGGPTRTINLLRAIARGCWILRQEWLYKSLEAGKWLEEEDYEMVEFSPAVQKCRLEKHSFGPLYSMDLFTTCGPVFVSRGSNPRCSDLEELLEICGGRVVRVATDAKVIVGEMANQDDVTCVSEKWILDSITQNKMKKLKNYIMSTRSSPLL